MRDYLKKRREELDMTQSAVAKKLDVSESYYSLIEKGERQIDMSIGMARKIASALDVSIESVLEMENQKGGDREKG